MKFTIEIGKVPCEGRHGDAAFKWQVRITDADNNRRIIGETGPEISKTSLKNTLMFCFVNLTLYLFSLEFPHAKPIWWERKILFWGKIKAKYYGWIKKESV